MYRMLRLNLFDRTVVLGSRHLVVLSSRLYILRCTMICKLKTKWCSSANAFCSCTFTFRDLYILWNLGIYMCESEIFVRIGGYESNQGLVIYRVQWSNEEQRCADSASFTVFNEVMRNRDVRILLVPQTILHDRSYSACKCVCSCYINIKS